MKKELQKNKDKAHYKYRGFHLVDDVPNSTDLRKSIFR